MSTSPLLYSEMIKMPEEQKNLTEAEFINTIIDLAKTWDIPDAAELDFEKMSNETLYTVYVITKAAYKTHQLELVGGGMTPSYPTHGLCGACGDWIEIKKWPLHFYQDCQVGETGDPDPKVPYILATGGETLNGGWLVYEGSLAKKPIGE